MLRTRAAYGRLKAARSVPDRSLRSLTTWSYRYSGPFNQLVEDIHQAVDTWAKWEPTNLTETMLKSAIDRAE